MDEKMNTSYPKRVFVLCLTRILIELYRSFYKNARKYSFHWWLFVGERYAKRNKYTFLPKKNTNIRGFGYPLGYQNGEDVVNVYKK